MDEMLILHKELVLRINTPFLEIEKQALLYTVGAKQSARVVFILRDGINSMLEHLTAGSSYGVDA